VRVLSLSLSDPNLYEAIKRAVSHNISVVAASGNDGDGNLETNEYRYPGAFEEVIEVGAINKK
jgi:major intracellular serine protease